LPNISTASGGICAGEVAPVSGLFCN
jgi:hypothetical protein